jgi:phosphate transport system protein
MSTHLRRDLDELQRHILAQAGAVEVMIHDAIRSLQPPEVGLAPRVIAQDDAIDREENEIEERCLQMLALHQPVAADLRRVVAVLKINTDLERMADLAVDIAEHALRMAELPPIRVPPLLQRMADLAIDMERESLEAFMQLDTRQARRVCGLDDEVDRCHTETGREMVRTLRARPELLEAGLSVLAVARHLERIADHATNIAEDVIYLAEGEIARHHSEVAGTADPE